MKPREPRKPRMPTKPSPPRKPRKAREVYKAFKVTISPFGLRELRPRPRGPLVRARSRDLGSPTTPQGCYVYIYIGFTFRVLRENRALREKV